MNALWRAVFRRLQRTDLSQDRACYRLPLRTASLAVILSPLGRRQGCEQVPPPLSVASTPRRSALGVEAIGYQDYQHSPVSEERRRTSLIRKRGSQVNNREGPQPWGCTQDRQRGAHPRCFKLTACDWATHIFRVANRAGIAPGKTFWKWKKLLCRKFITARCLIVPHCWLILRQPLRLPGAQTCNAPRIEDIMRIKHKTSRRSGLGVDAIFTIRKKIFFCQLSL